MNRKKTINEVVDINGSKVFLENGCLALDDQKMRQCRK